MKKFVFAAAAVLFSLSLPAQSDEYSPTSSWPYIYGDFVEGTLKMPGNEERVGLYNIHIPDGRLHFIEKDMVRSANPADVLSLTVSSDEYLNVGGIMMRVEASSEKGVVLQEYRVDMVKLNSTGAAYGASSNSMATKSLSSLDNIGTPMSNVNHMELKNAKNEGAVLPLLTVFYLKTDSVLTEASKKALTELSGDRAAEFKRFCKERKIRWKDPESLMEIADFL